MTQDTAVPSPASQLSRFRLARLRTGVEMIGQRAGAFRALVDAALADNKDEPDIKEGQSAEKSDKALAGTFSAAYLALSEALEAARSGSVVTGPALDALGGIMSNLKSQYANGIADLREGVHKLGRERGAFAQFCAAAAEKIDKLEQFWQTTYEHVPKMRMRAQ
jgi:hypothetical protein